MKMNGFKLLFLLVLVSVGGLIFALPGFAENGTIKVKCVDTSSNPIEVAVKVIPFGGAKPQMKKTNAKGEVEFTGLDDGAYRVFARQDGFEPALFEFVVLKGSKPREEVILKFAVGSSEKEFYFEDKALVQKTADLLNQGISLAKEKKYNEAEKIFKQSIEMDHSNPAAYRYLGVTLLQLSKFEEATDIFNKAEKYAGMLVIQQPQFQAVIDYVQEVKKQLPGIRAESSLREKNYERAATEYAEALKTNSNNPEWHFGMALALANLQKLDESVASLDKAIQLKPGEKKYEELKNQLAEQKVALKEQAEFQKMKAVQEEGNKLLKDEDFAGALAKFEALRDMMAPDKRGGVWRQIGWIQVKLNQQEAAEQSFKKAIELAKDEKAAQEYRTTLAQLYLDQKKYDEAINAFVDSQNSDPAKLEQSLLSLAQKSKDSTPQLAELALEKVIKLNPQNADAYFELGQLYFTEGKAKDSRTKELLAKYIEIGKDESKVKTAKDIMVSVNWRNSDKSKKK
jgi:tetratricopeptide (TPR) repeat protein